VSSYKEVYNEQVRGLFGKLENKRFKNVSSGKAPQETGLPATLVPFGFNISGTFDENDFLSGLVFIPDVVIKVIQAKVVLSFREFFAPATTVSSGGGSTSGSGGSSSPTSGSGDNIHSHVWAEYLDDTPSASTERDYGLGGTPSVHVTIKGPSSNLTTDVKSVTHTHTVTIASHTHSTPAHSHDLAYGVFKETMPGSLDVVLRVRLWDGASFNQVGLETGIDDEVTELDLSDYITVPGIYRIDIDSASGQPNDGRLGVDAAGYVVGAIQALQP
jgi:hypothetical protein